MSFLDFTPTRLRSFHTPSLYISQYIFLNVCPSLGHYIDIITIPFPFSFPVSLFLHLFFFFSFSCNDSQYLYPSGLVYITFFDYLDTEKRSLKENCLESLGSWQK